MKIGAEEYEQMRAWFAYIVPRVFPSELLNAPTHPVTILDQTAATSPAKARTGLAMAISDIVEMTADWPLDRVRGIDDDLVREKLPSLTALRVRFSKAVSRAVSRGSIKGDVEYHAVRNAAELAQEGTAPLWRLISDYEKSKGTV